jgi:hypothetical protein
MTSLSLSLSRRFSFSQKVSSTATRLVVCSSRGRHDRDFSSARDGLARSRRRRSGLFARILSVLCEANVQATAVRWSSKSVVPAAVVGSLTGRLTASLANYLQFTTKVTPELRCPRSWSHPGAANGVVFCERLLDWRLRRAKSAPSSRDGKGRIRNGALGLAERSVSSSPAQRSSGKNPDSTRARY